MNHKHTSPIRKMTAIKAIEKLDKHYKHAFILESKQVSLFSGRFSLIGIDPSLQISAKETSFNIKALNKRGNHVIKKIKPIVRELVYKSSPLTRGDVAFHATEGSLKGTITSKKNIADESERTKQPNTSRVIRAILKHYNTKEKTLLGLYGAFSYDFIRLFENIGNSLPQNDINDYTLYLYDTFIHFDHIKQQNNIITYRDTKTAAIKTTQQIKTLLNEQTTNREEDFSISNIKQTYTKESFTKAVSSVKKEIINGEIFQLILSNKTTASFKGSPLALYKEYREKNPSPYMYYFKLHNEYIVGASPEMMVRYEDGKLHTRPIAGTTKRSKDPLEDHQLVMELLNSEKEKAELDMIIDLSRNDMSRVSKPGIELSDYRFIEKYSRVAHTVAHLTSELEEGFTALDALISCTPLGTLSGAPKVSAMKIIEKIEPTRRGYYGGTIGYFSFSGEADTAIMIRTARIKDNKLTYQSGAGIVHDSIPENEYQETINKGLAFFETISIKTDVNIDSNATVGSGLCLEPHLSQASPTQKTQQNTNSSPKKQILIIDNFDSFTYNLVDYFEQLDCKVEVFRNSINPKALPQHPDLLVLSPGPSIPKTSGNLMKIIEHFHKSTPIFGVCLGLQAIVEYCGGSLQKNTPVHGKTSNITHNNTTLFKNLPNPLPIARYHSFSAKKVPSCLKTTATFNNITMAIEHKTLPISAVQFHPESILTSKNNHGLQMIQNLLNTLRISPPKKRDKYIMPSPCQGGGASTSVEAEGISVGQRGPEHAIITFLQQTENGELSLSEQQSQLKNLNITNPTDLASIVRYFQKKSAFFKQEGSNTVDICGTGGSGQKRINTSTPTAFILAALNIPTTKHGNKAASGRCGSFDVLEQLNIPIPNNQSDIELELKKNKLSFIFARYFHPAFKHFAPVRKAIGKPTFFNLLGPLLNPMNPNRQIIGTSKIESMQLIAQTAKELGKKRVIVIHAEDGLDKASLTGKTHITELKNDEITSYIITPADFGIEPATPAEVQGGDTLQNTFTTQQILNNKCTSRQLDQVLLNAALAIKVSGKEENLKKAYQLAKSAIVSGKTKKLLQRIKTPFAIQDVYKKRSVDIMNKSKGININSSFNIESKFIIQNSSFSTRNFKAAISKPVANSEQSRRSINLIAEIKKASPSKGIINPQVDVAKQAKAYEQSGAAAISILTEPTYFKGSMGDLQTASQATKIPILCKDFITTKEHIYQARKHGADAILLIASELSTKHMTELILEAKKLHMDALCEVHNQSELKKVLKTPAEVIGINNRNLKTLKTDLNTTTKLLKLIDKYKAAKHQHGSPFRGLGGKKLTIVSESGIFTNTDVQSLPQQTNAILVGTSIMQNTFPQLKIKELLSKPLLKICGVQTPKEAKHCQELGVDFIGLNFVPTSKRYISINKAKTILEIYNDSHTSIKLSPDKGRCPVSPDRGVLGFKQTEESIPATVGIFQNQPIKQVNKIALELNLNFIQLSGEEDEEYIQKCIRPVIMGVNVKNAKQINKVLPCQGEMSHFVGQRGPCTNIAYILIDGPTPGSATQFDHTILNDIKIPYMLAGGINISNLSQLYKTHRPLGFDIASGAETNRKRDFKKIRKLSNLLKSC